LGTRQELGVFLLLLLVGAFHFATGAIAPAASEPACQKPFEMAGDLETPGVLCDPGKIADPKLLGDLEVTAACVGKIAAAAGERVTLSGGTGNECRQATAPMAGGHLILLGQKIDLNRARAQDLEAIPGIGPVLAERIVAERERRGRFGAVEDLLDVSGIGPVRLARARDFVKVEER
jgi:competence protein ComEA